MTIEPLMAQALIHRQAGQTAMADALYRQVLESQPEHRGALSKLAAMLAEMGRFEEAASFSDRLLALTPDDPWALCLAGTIRTGLQDAPAAIEAYGHCLAVSPDNAFAAFRLGQISARLGQKAEAAVLLEHAATLTPDDPDLLGELGCVLQDIGQTERALDVFRRARGLRPVITLPTRPDASASAKAGFSVLLLMSPMAANTPVEYLLEEADYDSHAVSLLPGVEPDYALLESHGDVVLNMISDVDRGEAVALLHQAEAIIERLGKPVVNAPAAILPTGRETVARALAGIPDCRVPGTERFSGAELLSRPLPERLAALERPWIVRAAGTHGGDAMEKVRDASEVAAFVSANRAAAYYVTEFADYLSEDGYYRKYRLVFVDGEVFPYHLAIGDQWKLHHFRTDMKNQAWMQAEEAAFLRAPEGVFGPRQMAALEAIRRTVGLDYFGIDCSLDREGAVVVFEVNASMLVHGDNNDMPYKDAAAERIRQAFNAMMRRRAQRSPEPHPA